MPRIIIYIALVCLTVFIYPIQGHGKSLAGLVKEGNNSYNAGEYDKAVSSYDEALKDAAESPYIWFNKGAALFKKGDYAGAGEAFEKAALKSKDPLLEAKSKFNLGDSAYKEAEALKEKDLQKALEGCSKSIGHYQDALKLDPDLKESAENIEMVRLVMRNILDEINKQKKSAQEDRKKNKETAEKIKEIIKEQEAALSKNRKLDAERTGKGDTPNVTKEIEALSAEQKAIRDKTEALSKELQKDKKSDASKEDTVAKHVENAVKDQEAAAGNLDQRNTKVSADNQKEAVKELKEALESQEKDSSNGTGENKENQQDKQGDSQKDKQGGQQQQESSSDKNQQGENNQGQDQVSAADVSDDAQDILKEEKQNKEQRKAFIVRGYKEVDKDW